MDPSWEALWDAFQETDIIGISTPVTKWNYQITEASEIQIMPKAFFIARIVQVLY
jgi:acetolactate synthase-1/2/3 large subunit